AAQANRLVEFWQDKTTSRIVKPYHAGLLGLALGRESLYDFRPLRARLARAIDPNALATSGRSLRVGTVSFWDGRYREIMQTTGGLAREQFLEYILASASIPVVAKMPTIREEETQPSDADLWAQFGDGGLRHNTPITGFFPADRVKLLE